RIGILSCDPNYVALIGLVQITGVSEAIAAAVVAFQVVEVLKFIIGRGTRTLKIFEFNLEVRKELRTLWRTRRFRGVGYARVPRYQCDGSDCRCKDKGKMKSKEKLHDVAELGSSWIIFQESLLV